MKHLRFSHLFILLLLYSCSSFNNFAPGYVEAFRTIKLLYTGYDNPITSEIVNSIPYSSALLKIGNGPTGLIILESKKDGIETWVSADNIYIQMENGKVIKTAGLNNNLVAHVSNGNFSENILSQKNFQYTSYLSYDFPELNNLEIKNTLINTGLQKVQLLSGEARLTLYKEKFVNKYLNWKGINEFWVDETGYVIKSKQFISTKLPPIEIEVTKKPAM